MKFFKDKRIRLYELADMEDMDNLIDLKYTEISVNIQKLNEQMKDLNLLIFQRRTEEFNFLSSRKVKEIDKRKNKK
jgi:hypothetical protein